MHNGIRSYNIGIFENTMAKIKDDASLGKVINYCRGADAENYETFKEVFG